MPLIKPFTKIIQSVPLDKMAQAPAEPAVKKERTPEDEYDHIDWLDFTENDEFNEQLDVCSFSWMGYSKINTTLFSAAIRNS